MTNSLIRHTLTAALILGSLAAQPTQLDSGGSVVLMRNQGTVRYLGLGLDGEGASQDAKFRPTTINLPANLLQLSAGDQHALYLLDTGVILASGLNHRGQLGFGAISVAPDLYEDVATSPFVGNFVGIEAGRGVSYAWTPTGLLFGWGGNIGGQMGTPPNANNVLQPAIVPIPADIVAVESALQHTIALDSLGRVWQWGLLPWIPGVWTPPTLVPGLVAIQSIATSLTHAVALSNSGNVVTWGLDAPFIGSNLPVGNAANPTLTPIGGMPPITVIAAGLDFTLCLDNTGRVWSAGASPKGFGFLEGSGYFGPRSFEARVIPGLNNIVDVAAAGSQGFFQVPGDRAGYAYDTSGQLWAWGGRDRATGLGLGNPGITQVEPTRVPMTGFVPRVQAGSGNCITVNGGAFTNFGLGFIGGEISLNQTSGPNTWLFAAPGPPNFNVVLTLSPFCHVFLDLQGMLDWIAAGVSPIPSLPSPATATPQYGSWRINIPNDPALSGYVFSIQSATLNATTSSGLALSSPLTYTLR